MSERVQKGVDVKQRDVAEALADLAAALSCSQCGRPFSDRACGPTHAVIQADPRQHRLIQPLIEDAAQKGERDVLRAAAEMVADANEQGLGLGAAYRSIIREADRIGGLIDFQEPTP